MEKPQTKNTIKIVIQWACLIGAVFLLVTFILYAFTRKGNDLWGLVPISALLVVLLLIAQGKVKWLKLSTEGIEAILEEAQQTTVELKELMKNTAIAVLGLIKRSGRMGGYSYDEKENIREEILNDLQRIGILLEEIEKIEQKSKWHKYTELDFVYYILQGQHFPSGSGFQPGIELNEGMTLRSRRLTDLPTPDELKDFLRKYNLLNEELEEIIEDYRYYIKNHKQRRPHIWAKRDDWYKYYS